MAMVCPGLVLVLCWCLVTGTRGSRALTPLSRRVEHNGFHIELQTGIDSRGLAVCVFDPDCAVYLVDSFPAGAFVDLDDLRGVGEAEVVARRDGRAIPFVEIERPAESSRPFTLTTRLTPAHLSIRTVLRHSFQARLRYHHAAMGPTRRRVVIPPPRLCLAGKSTSALPRHTDQDMAITSPSAFCEQHRPEGAWNSFGLVHTSRDREWILAVPVGDLATRGVVNGITTAVTLLGACALVVTSALY